ncbi:uncharacterized protein [Spinacia oleracea]|uniref:Uncharacterized protein n=1 Tax=Spinacia oleracea TaxID=3562 RepID=A0ABM3QR59_SPIOL|nr:uncharacterized protein LOC110795946 [Spinacia oleracea]
MTTVIELAEECFVDGKIVSSVHNVGLYHETETQMDEDKIEPETNNDEVNSELQQNNEDMDLRAHFTNDPHKIFLKIFPKNISFPKNIFHFPAYLSFLSLVSLLVPLSCSLRAKFNIHKTHNTLRTSHRAAAVVPPPPLLLPLSGSLLDRFTSTFFQIELIQVCSSNDRRHTTVHLAQDLEQLQLNVQETGCSLNFLPPMQQGKDDYLSFFQATVSVQLCITL